MGKIVFTIYQPARTGTTALHASYTLDLESNLATEIWNFPKGESLFSPFCSSVYEDSPNNYLIDYSIITNLGIDQLMELVGVSSSAETVFDYRYFEASCNGGWNAIPIHLDGMQFTSIVPTGAVSRKIHGTAGAFDLPLRLSGIPAVECRSGGSDGQYQMVVTFPRPVTVVAATVTHDPRKAAAVSAVSGGLSDEIIVNLSNVSNAQTITVNLVEVSDGVISDDVSIPMTVLIGDTSGNGSVNASDLSKAKSVLGEPATPSSYRSDVVTDGDINDNDLSTIQSFIGTGVLAALISAQPRSRRRRSARFCGNTRCRLASRMAIVMSESSGLLRWECSVAAGNGPAESRQSARPSD